MFAVNPSKSSTYHALDPNKYGEFDITYQDETNVTGLMIQESVTINGVVLVNQTMGLALNSTEPRSLMGLGFDTGVSTLDEADPDVQPYKYPTVIDNLVSQGFIKKPVFSMYLNSLEDRQGNILFGGVDTDKFYDELVTMPIVAFGDQSNKNGSAGYSVQLQNLSAIGLDTVSGGSLQALMDSGTTQTLIPSAWLKPIISHFEVEADSAGNTWLDCAMAQKHGNIKLAFQFVGKTIYVPMSTMIWRQTLSSSDTAGIHKDIPDSKSWSSICTFGLGSSDGKDATDEGTGVFGDTFMRNAYVVHDLENFRVGLAQSHQNSTTEKIVEVSDQGGIPSATGSPLPASFTQGNDTPLATNPVASPTSDNGNGTSGDKGNSAAGSNLNVLGSILAAVLVSAIVL